MAKVLGVVSTPYHLLVFLFVKDAFLSGDEVDLIVRIKRLPWKNSIKAEG